MDEHCFMQAIYSIGPEIKKIACENLKTIRRGIGHDLSFALFDEHKDQHNLNIKGNVYINSDRTEYHVSILTEDLPEFWITNTGYLENTEIDFDSKILYCKNVQTSQLNEHQFADIFGTIKITNFIFSQKINKDNL